MSYDKSWMHRVFPSLSKKEAEGIVDKLDERDTSDLRSLVEIAERLRAKTQKAVRRSTARIKSGDFDRQFVFGTEPIPDLATGENVRRELQERMAMWLKDFARIQDHVAVNLLAHASRTVKAQRRRCLLWHLAEGKIKRRGIIDELSKILGREPFLCRDYEFCPTNKKVRTRAVLCRDAPFCPTSKKVRTRVVRELIKDMRSDLKGGGRAYLLNEQEEMKITTRLSFENMESDPPPNKM